jgi:hypothetical protein
MTNVGLAWAGTPHAAQTNTMDAKPTLSYAYWRQERAEIEARVFDMLVLL